MHRLLPCGLNLSRRHLLDIQRGLIGHLALNGFPNVIIKRHIFPRQEVGSHGRDTGGIFRVHQFQKV